MSPTRVVTEYDKYLFHVFLLVLVWAPIPLGSNRLWSAMLLVFVSAALLSIWLLLFLKDKLSSPAAIFNARWALLSLVVFQLWVLVQSFAFPAVFINYASPEAFSLYQQAGFTEKVYLSLGVDSSQKAFVLGLGFTLAFVLTLLLVNTPERKRQFYKTLVFSGVLQASIGILMVLIDQEMFSDILQLFYSNEFSASGTFVNSNHYAGYINICLAVGVGLLVSQFNKKQSYTNIRAYLRSLIEGLLSANTRLRIYLMVMLIGLVMSYSRMGNIAFWGAITISAMLLLIQQKKLNIKTLVLLASLLVIDVLIVGAWFGVDKLADRIEKTDFGSNTRVEINAVSRPILMDYFFSGAGADTYKVIEPAYNTRPSNAITEHAHNDYYEFFINTGLVGVICLLMFIMFIIKEVFSLKGPDKNNLKKSDFALMMLITYVAIHSLADFNLQIPAFAYTLLACLAIAFVSQHSEKHGLARK